METLTMSANETNKQSASAAQTAALPANVMAALGYFCGLAAILALVLDPYRTDRKARFHAIQALLFQGTCFVSYIVIAMISFVLGIVMNLVLGTLGLGATLGILWGIPTMLTSLVSLAMFGTWVYLMIRSAMDHNVTLPVIGPMAERMSQASAGSKS